MLGEGERVVTNFNSMSSPERTISLWLRLSRSVASSLPQEWSKLLNRFTQDIQIFRTSVDLIFSPNPCKLSILTEPSFVSRRRAHLSAKGQPRRCCLRAHRAPTAARTTLSAFLSRTVNKTQSVECTEMYIFEL